MSQSAKLIFGGIAALLSAAVLYVGIQMGVEPMWICIGAVVLPVAVFLIGKYPPLLIAALLFVGSYKTQAAGEAIRLTDPTLIVVVLLAIAAAWQMLLMLGGVRGSLRDIFQGQGNGVVAFLLFLFVFAGSYLYTPASGLGADKLMRFVAFDVLAFFAPFVLLRKERDFRLLIGLIVAAAVPLGIRLIIGIAHPTEQQLMGNADVTSIGTAQLIGITILILLYYRLPSRFGRLFAFIALPILAVGLIASIARGPILMLLTVILITMVMLPGQGIVSRATMLLSVLVLTVIMAASLLWVETLPVAQNRGPGKIAELTAIAHGQLDAGGTTSKRLDYYSSSMVAFFRNPFLGVGLAGWPVFFGDQTIPYPHNFVLEVAAEQGLLGLAALLALLASAFAAVWWLRKYPNEYAFVLPVFLFCVLSNMVSGGIDNRVLFFWIGAAFWVGGMGKKRIEQPRMARSEAPDLLGVSEPIRAHASPTHRFRTTAW